MEEVEVSFSGRPLRVKLGILTWGQKNDVMRRASKTSIKEVKKETSTEVLIDNFTAEEWITKYAIRDMEYIDDKGGHPPRDHWMKIMDKLEYEEGDKVKEVALGLNPLFKGTKEEEGESG